LEPILDVYTANESLQILWGHFKVPEVDLKLTLKEIKYLQLTLVDEWDTLTTHYTKQLVTQDKLDLLSIMSKGLPMFK
jgi:hypothetical protein